MICELYLNKALIQKKDYIIPVLRTLQWSISLKKSSLQLSKRPYRICFSIWFHLWLSLHSLCFSLSGFITVLHTIGTFLFGGLHLPRSFFSNMSSCLISSDIFQILPFWWSHPDFPPSPRTLVSSSHLYLSPYHLYIVDIL